jgi:hypothetical protein
MTDNHSSKLFIKNANSIFLGDLLDRHLDHIGVGKKMQKVDNSVIGSVIFCEEEEASIEEQAKNESSPILSYFNFLKYSYFLLYEFTKQAVFKEKLKNDTVNLTDLKYFYSLGNHDCGRMIKQDFAAVFPVYYENANILYDKIDRISRYLIPAEIVFVSSSTKDIFVFSHSGGMFLLPDDIRVVEKKHRDFIIKSYDYSYTNFANKKKFNKLSLEDRFFISKVYQVMEANRRSSISDTKQDRVSHPSIWCDFFENISENDCCKGEQGRYKMMNVLKTPVLKSLLNILKLNYGLEEVGCMRIFRGHEHQQHTLESCFKDDIFYNVSYKNNELEVVLHHLAPIFFDNKYTAFMKNNQDIKSFDTVCSVKYYMNGINNEARSEGFFQKKDTNDVKIPLGRMFFNNQNRYELCNYLVNIIDDICKRLELFGCFHKNKILNISSELQEDDNIIKEVLETLIEKIEKGPIGKEFAENSTLISEKSNGNAAEIKKMLHCERAMYILSLLKKLKNRIDYNGNCDGLNLFMGYIYQNILNDNYDSIIENWTKETKEDLDNRLEECLNKNLLVKLWYRRFFMILGLLLPFICMNIEKSGSGNIVVAVGISMLSFLLIDRLSIDKKINIHTSIFMLAPIFLSVLFLFLNNKNAMSVLNNIFDYVSFNAWKDNYFFFKTNGML